MPPPFNRWVFAIYWRWLFVYCDQLPQLLETGDRARSSQSDRGSRRRRRARVKSRRNEPSHMMLPHERARRVRRCQLAPEDVAHATCHLRHLRTPWASYALQSVATVPTSGTPSTLMTGRRRRSHDLSAPASLARNRRRVRREPRPTIPTASWTMERVEIARRMTRSLAQSSRKVPGSATKIEPGS